MSMSRCIIWRDRITVLHSFILCFCDPYIFFRPQIVRNLSLTSSVKTSNQDDDVDFSSITNFLPSHQRGGFIPLRKCKIMQKKNIVRYTMLDSSQNADEKYQEILTRKIISNIKSSEEYNQHCIKARLDYQSFRKCEGRIWTTIWRDIRDVLIRKSPTHGTWLKRAVKVTFPPAWAEKFYNSVDDFMYDICNAHDCTAEVADPQHPQTYTSFFLSGSETAIKEVLLKFIQEVPGVKITRPHIIWDSVRHVPSEKRRPRTPAHMVSRPDCWNLLNLLEYVEDLTKFDATSHFLRYTLPSNWPRKSNYCVIVMGLMRELIQNPITRPYISRTAFHKAMIYFVKKNRLDYARELFATLGYFGLKRTVETYNIMLRGSALLGDFHNFHFIIHMMLNDGCKPNGKTWAAFLMLVPYHSFQQDVYERMKELGLLSHTKTLQITVENLIQSELRISLRNKQDHKSFTEMMNQKYGSKWLSVEAVNRALTVFGKLCLPSRAFQLLEYMEDCFQFPNVWSVNTLLYSCSLSPDPQISLMELMTRGKFQALLNPGQETCRILFKLAWMTRSYNMAKIIWRYACLSATTSIPMRNRVARCFRTFVSPFNYETHLKRLFVAGAVIMGPTEQKHPMQSSLCLSLPPVVDKLDSSIEISKSLDLIGENNIVNRISLDLQMFKDWRPSKPFGSILWKAIKRDEMWKTDLVFYHKDVNWFLENSEPVEIYEKAAGSCRNIIWS